MNAVPTTSQQRLVRLCNAATEAIREMEKCPNDSVQDIWNESLESWKTGFRMDYNHNIEPKILEQYL
jgi:hypothetical protein